MSRPPLQRPLLIFPSWFFVFLGHFWRGSAQTLSIYVICCISHIFRKVCWYSLSIISYFILIPISVVCHITSSSLMLFPLWLWFWPWRSRIRTSFIVALAYKTSTLTLVSIIAVNEPSASRASMALILIGGQTHLNVTGVTAQSDLMTTLHNHKLKSTFPNHKVTSTTQ